MISLNIVIPAIAMFLYGVLFFGLAFAKTETNAQARNIYRTYLVTMFFWSLSALLVFISKGNEAFWFRMMFLSTIGSTIAIFRFVQTMLGRRWVWAGWVYTFGGLGMLFGLIPNLAVHSVSVDAGVLNYKLTPWVAVLAGPGYVFNIFSLVQLIIGYRESSNPLERNRLYYLMIGLGLVLVSSMSNFTPLGRYPIDIAGSAINALLVAYAILRHQLLDIQVVIRKGLLYSIPTILIGAGYFLIMSLALRYFNLYQGVNIFFVSLVVAIITALVMQPLRDRAQFWIDRIFFREKYDSSRMLQRLSSKVASILDLDEITNMILEEVVSTLHIENAAFFLKREEDGGNFHLKAHKGMKSNVNVRMAESHPVVKWLADHDQILSRHNLEVAPQFKAIWGQEREELAAIKGELLIPLKVKGSLVGIFVVGPKRSEEGFTQDDQLTLGTLANQVAVAIDNARLFSAEQSRRTEIDCLYDLARQLVAFNDVDSIFRCVTTNVVKSVRVSFARILTCEEDGSFLCRSSMPIRDMRYNLGSGQIEPASIQPIYSRIMAQADQIVLEKDNPIFSPTERDHLFLGQANSLCITPIRVANEALGLLVLGEARSKNREPFDGYKLQLVKAISDQVASALRRATLHERLEEGFIETVKALAKAMDARDVYTQDHSERIANMVEALCRSFNFDESRINVLRWASVLHDIGKIGVPDSILNKPNSLTEDEWVIMKRHPIIGAEIVAPIKELGSVAPIIRSHHESYDGRGYPDGLKGDQIPFDTRILTIVDAYVAMCDDRVYHKGKTHAEAIDELLKSSGTQFDPMIVDAFLTLFNQQLQVQEIHTLI